MGPTDRMTTCALSAAATLDTWSNHAWSDGLQIDELENLDVLSVRTRNSVYKITILSGHTGEVIVQGGRFFPEATRVRLAGSTLGGSFLKRHGIYVGFRMELHHDRQATITTAVRSIHRISDYQTQ
jgi:hypothetical protein